MSASDELKERIEQYFNGTQVANSEKDWKRTQKLTIAGETVREFSNAKLGRAVLTIGDDADDAGIYERDQWVYGYFQDEEGNRALAFEPEDRWKRTGFVYDQHQHYILKFFHHLSADFDEVTENTFVTEEHNLLKLHILLAKHGFKHDAALTQFLTDHNSPGAGAPNPHPNPPTPPALNPTWVDPLAALVSNPLPTASFPAGAMPGNAQQALQQAANIAGSFGAGGISIGGQVTPAVHTNTMGYVELGLQACPQVVAALVAARLLGKRGLEQESSAWDDQDKIQDNLDNGHIDEVEIERSHALWLLYEDADDGTGTLLPDFFSMHNDDLVEHISDMFETEAFILDDTAAYNAPYDLPVPQVPPPPVYNPPAQARPGPMVGPASMNARAGSFAALPAAPAAVAPPAPPPGNAAADMRNDSGDKWAEFCNEVWDTYEANKANLPLDLTWMDRYRPRDVQVTGLGFRFERQEYTGVRLQMGYLDREGALVEVIDIPARVFEELFKDFGGQWNIDDVTQFVNKRKGENAEGFTFSSQELWEELEPMLLAAGWKEAK